jgi:hypothetical protein
MLATFVLRVTVLPTLPCEMGFYRGDDDCRASRLLVFEPGLTAENAPSRFQRFLSIHACRALIGKSRP